MCLLLSRELSTGPLCASPQYASLARLMRRQSGALCWQIIRSLSFHALGTKGPLRGPSKLQLRSCLFVKPDPKRAHLKKGLMIEP